MTKAIATSHDIGHSPFGHKGEKILCEISKKDLGHSFWHEKNGLKIADNIELLVNYNSDLENMNLTYAVRDGIISHCGEVDENGLKPRNDFLNLDDYSYPNQYAPYTWEGCVVKVSDKISYIMRDIEDAVDLHILDDQYLDELYTLLNFDKNKKINNSSIITALVSDICSNSSPEKGLTLSENNLNMLNSIKKFNYQHIYNNKQVKYSEKYFNLVINQIYEFLKDCYDSNNTLEKFNKVYDFSPMLVQSFINWIEKYWNLTDRKQTNLKNKIVFNMDNEKDYYQAIIYFISGMTDNFAINCYNDIIGF